MMERIYGLDSEFPTMPDIMKTFNPPVLQPAFAQRILQEGKQIGLAYAKHLSSHSLETAIEELFKDEKPAPKPEPVKSNSKIKQIQLHTAAELVDMNLQPPKSVVSELLNTGVYILAAPSKMGKSWLAMDLSLAVSTGRPFLGFDVSQGAVIYFALEDSLNRLKARLLKLTGYQRPPEGVMLATEAADVSHGFMEQLEMVLQQQHDVNLVIIDTLQKVKPPSRRDQTAYEADYKVLSDFAALARKYDVCILFLHHTKKSNGFDTDPFESILGSTALQGAADGMLTIKKKQRTDDEATLYAAGRDIEQQELIISFDKECCRWKNHGSLEQVEQQRLQESFNSNPIVITLKKKLDEIINDPDEPIKEYVCRMKDLRQDVITVTGVLIGSSERNFATEAVKLDDLLLLNNVQHITPSANTTYRGQDGRFHRYKYIKEK